MHKFFALGVGVLIASWACGLHAEPDPAAQSFTDPWAWRVHLFEREPLIRDIPAQVLGVPVNGLRLTVSPVASPVHPGLGEKAMLRVTIKNVSDKTAMVPLKRPFDECGLTTLVEDPRGDRVPYRWVADRKATKCQVSGFGLDWKRNLWPLDPGKSWEYVFDLAEEFPLDDAGPYTIVVKHPLYKAKPNGLIDKGDVTFVTSNKTSITLY